MIVFSNKACSLLRILIVFVSLAIYSTAYSLPVASTLVFPRYKSANIGIVIRDLETGKELVSRNSDKLMTPASILKCVTSAAVLLADKEECGFTTEVLMRGNVTSDSLLIGDIIIRAVGDPTIESRCFPEHQGFLDSIVSKVDKMGIKKIAGVIEIDSTGIVEQGPGQKWELEDLKWSYGTGWYPLNFKDNSLPGDRAMKDPGACFKAELKEKLAYRDVLVDGNDVDFGEMPMKSIYSHSSPLNKQIMREMMEMSNNLFAESMLRVLRPDGPVADALSIESRLLNEAGLDSGNVVAFDGSGLTRSNLVTPVFMADLLETMTLGDKGGLYVSLFPKVGEEGTVKNLLKGTPLAGNLLLKSGSMRGVLCYAGYKVDGMGVPTHAVVIMVNGYTCKSLSVRNAIGDYLLRVFK